MDFKLSNEQELLRDGLVKFLTARYDLAKSRQAAKVGAGWQPAIWRAFADELGLLGATLPERVGGLGGGAEEAMIIAEALGHALVVEPYVDTVVVAGGLLQRAGGARAEAVLKQIVAGSAIVALAAIESESRDNLAQVSTTAVREGDGWVLHGAKAVVTSAPLATHLLIPASTSEGLSLFLTEFEAAAPAPGIHAHGYRTIDDRRAADLVFSGLRLPRDALLGVAGRAAPSLMQARDDGAVAVSAEAVGCMRKVLFDTVEYCKQRRQFGQPIGSFQVLQHRMVDMYMELEQAVAAVYLAVLKANAEATVRSRAVAAAKATVGRAARFISQNSVQLHGAMGMTEELAIGHYFKRLTAIQYEFGSSAEHIMRYAQLSNG